MAKEQVTQQSSWRIWWKLLRPHTLTAAFVPVLIGTSFALQYGNIHLILFIAMLMASLLIQSATNMFNEYYDYKKGLDNEQSVGIGGAIVHHGIRATTVLNLGISFCIVALLIGIYICMMTSWWLAVIGLICMAAGYLYTGGPYPIAYTPFGEIIAGLFMGLFIILISFYIQTLHITTESLLIAIPIALLIGGILMANNIRDLEGDQAKGRKTLAILAGRRQAINILLAMFVSAYIWIIALILLQVVSPWLLLVLLSLPKSLQAIHLFRSHTTNVALIPAMKATAQVNTFFGLLLTIGINFAYWL